MFSCKVSDEIYDEVNELAQLISIYKNPQLFPFDINVQVPEAERFSIIRTLEDRFMELVS
jgi:hypothetical protein